MRPSMGWISEREETLSPHTHPLKYVLYLRQFAAGNTLPLNYNRTEEKGTRNWVKCQPQPHKTRRHVAGSSLPHRIPFPLLKSPVNRWSSLGWTLKPHPLPLAKGLYSLIPSSSNVHNGNGTCHQVLKYLDYFTFNFRCGTSTSPGNQSPSNQNWSI